MIQTEELRLKCLELAATQLSGEPHNIETLIHMAQEFYNFVTERPKAVGYDAPYEVSYIAEKPTGAISREWLYDKLTEMLEGAKKSRLACDKSGNPSRYYACDGQCDALQCVIELITPHKQEEDA